MKKKLILIKLGGSLITDKLKPFTIREDIIRNLAKQVKEVMDERKDLLLIVGNGGGSFPHFPAVRYQMEEGIKNEKQKYGFCLVQDAAAQLNRIIVGAFLREKIKAISFNPSSSLICQNGKIKTFYLDSMLGYLNLGLIPVIYGDIVFDKKKGSKILSTEVLINFLALKLKKYGFFVEKIIHNGITKGVLDEQGNVIKKISKRNFYRIEKVLKKTAGFDVTGGMRHKINEALEIAKKGIKTFIINGGEGKILKKAILGESVEGTIIE